MPELTAEQIAIIRAKHLHGEPIPTFGTEDGEENDDVDLTKEELRDEIEKLTGERPHHFTGRENLVAQYKEALAGSD